MKPPKYVLRFAAYPRNWHIHWLDNWLSWREASELERRMHAAGVDARLRAEFDACRARLSPKSELHTGGVNGCWVYCPADAAPRVLRLLAEATGIEPAPWPGSRRVSGSSLRLHGAGNSDPDHALAGPLGHS